MNLSTKEDIINKLIKSYKRCQKESNNDEILIGRVVEKAGIKQTDKNQIFDLFGVDKYEDIFKQIPKATIINNGNRNKLVKICELEKSEEKQMENTNTKNHDRIEKLLTILKQGLYEKDEAIRLALLTAISGESIFFLGAPGCAKSMIARRIVQAFKANDKEGLKYFETLLNAYTTPDEVFGNVSLKGLNGELPECKDKEVYRRLTEGMLPEADIAFLDEIWKANSTILNSLLTIVNERKFHNGNEVKDVPLKALFTASNELPAKDQGLKALYDRLILRLVVSFIDDEDNFFEMVNAPSSTEFKVPEDVKKLQISNAELKEWKEKIDEVSLSDVAKSVISAIRKELASRNDAMNEEDKERGEFFEVGDRRWKRIVHILKTSAFLNDRTEVDLMDCQLIEYCIWNTEKQQKVAREIVEKCIQQNGLDCDTAIDEIKEQIEEFDAYITDNFYIDNPDFKKIVKETIDGEEYYEIDYDDNTKRCWISKKTLLNSDKKTKITDIDSLDVDEDSHKINCRVYEKGRYVRKEFYGYYWSSEKIKDPKVFETPDLLDLRRTKVEKDKYKVIANDIELEIRMLDDFAKEQSAPYKANLFADQHYCDVIMNAVTEAKKDLQNAQVELDKKRSRYQD